MFEYFGIRSQKALPLWGTAGLYVLSVGAALVIAALIIFLTGSSWTLALEAMWEGSFENPGRWGQTLTIMAPLGLVALGALLSFRAGLVNIGQEGQVLIGGAFAAYAGIHWGGPSSLILVIVLVFGFLGGAIWSSIAALLKFWRGVPEVLTTLLLITPALLLSGYALRHKNLLGNPDAGLGNRSFSSPKVGENSRVSELEIFNNRFSISLVVLTGLAILVWLVFRSTILGFRLTILGHNALIAKRAGVLPTRYGFLTLAVSGGLAGLGGAFILTTGITSYSFAPGFSLNFGWIGLLVALVARNKALAVLPVALLFASLHTGSQFLASTGVERQIGDITGALIVLALLLPPAVYYWLQNRKPEIIIEGAG